MNAQLHAAIGEASWAERNQQWLVARIADLRARIEQMQAGAAPVPPRAGPATDFVPALDRCAQLFGLSRFESELLLLCAGVALDSGLAAQVADVTGHLDGAPSFSMATATLDDPHWDALSPQAPLRFWQLIVTSGDQLVRGPLRIDERVLHYLTAVSAVDERLDGLVEPLRADTGEAASAPWLGEAVATLHRAGKVRLERAGVPIAQEDWLPLLADAGRSGLLVRLRDLPEDPATLVRTLRLIDREAAFASALLILDCDGASARAGHVSEQLRTMQVIVGAGADTGTRLQARRIELPAWTASGQAGMLAHRAVALGTPLDEARMHEAIADSCEQFMLATPQSLDDVAGGLATAGDDPARIAKASWALLRRHSRAGLDDLAQRIDSTTTLDDLVLPPAQLNLLRDIGHQLRHQRQVYRDWGFATRSGRGLGLAALFAGESGTGKTMAAEAIANAAALDLYRIDLASTVSKYIGETEKNLRRIFDQAERGGCVLLFDEADALFGKRTEVKDSHDRYANIEVAYLLQRIEAYRGLVILTTNMKSALDRAFLRRIRFVVQFPFPDERAREGLWQRQLPDAAPRDGDIRWGELARLHLAGGNIRSATLHAAFIAAHEGTAISQRHLTCAAHAELAKLERSTGVRTGATS
ncbi:ATP-binding protein [Dyella ginsengisoli]|uniref:ATP-binding protein n=1 Tax=Dyella ginsengisoli TaxID=363848 RepID=UPI0003498A98|nr:ATP-binding protein [Dyella ginsengisoli]